MADTFYLFNICPQCPEFKRCYWNKLEKRVRDLTKEQNIFVITGTLYLPYTESDGKRFVKYQVIGKNDVAVPSQFYEVITMEDWQGRKEMTAYVLPNEKIADEIPLDNFRTAVQHVEKVAGLIFEKVIR